MKENDFLYYISEKPGTWAEKHQAIFRTPKDGLMYNLCFEKMLNAAREGVELNKSQLCRDEGLTTFKLYQWIRKYFWKEQIEKALERENMIASEEEIQHREKSLQYKLRHEAAETFYKSFDVSRRVIDTVYAYDTLSAQDLNTARLALGNIEKIAELINVFADFTGKKGDATFLVEYVETRREDLDERR